MVERESVGNRVLFLLTAVVDRTLPRLVAAVGKDLVGNRELFLQAVVVDKHLAVDTSYNFSPYIYARQQIVTRNSNQFDNTLICNQYSLVNTSGVCLSKK